MDMIPLFLMGALIGGAASVLGVGGGVFIVPLLPILTEMGQRETIATSLMTIFLIACLNSYLFHRRSLIHWQTVWMIGPYTALGSYMMAYWSYRFSEIHLRIIAICVIVLMATKTLWVRRGPRPKANRLQGSLIGVFIGGLSGLTGIGSGILLSPLLLNWGRIKNACLAPTVNGIMIFTTFFGVLSFFDLPEENITRWGWIHMEKVLILFIPASISSYFGRKHQNKINTYWRRLILGVLLIMLVLQMCISLVTTLLFGS